jgi:L-ribulose-5-phosphate 4-epimerase
MSGGELQERGGLRDLREQVVEANRGLVTAGLVTLSFGNASGVDRDRGVLLIKPSGLACDELRPQDVVAVSLRDGSVVEGGLRPSSDTPTHLALYRRFGSIGGVVHTHSPYASAWAQAGRAIPCLGTTHADHFAAPVPVTRQLTADEIAGDYELETGRVIVETLEEAGLDPSRMPAALVASHGPFTWGADAAEAVISAVALEAVAALAWRTLALTPAPAPGSAAGPTAISPALSARHFARKHGPDAYYGQPVEGGSPA